MTAMTSWPPSAKDWWHNFWTRKLRLSRSCPCNRLRQFYPGETALATRSISLGGVPGPLAAGLHGQCPGKGRPRFTQSGSRTWAAFLLSFISVFSVIPCIFVWVLVFGCALFPSAACSHAIYPHTQPYYYYYHYY